MTRAFPRQRGVTLLELLVGVAMPLKYLAGEPMMVRIVGSLHGLLFVLFVGLLRVGHGFAIAPPPTAGQATGVAVRPAPPRAGPTSTVGVRKAQMLSPSAQK